MSAYIKTTGGNTGQIFKKVFVTDFEVAWESTLDALKNSRLDVTNKEGGFIQTKWIENTSEKNFIDAYGNGSAFLKAQFRLKISLEKGFFKKKSTIRISILKEQFIERDVLEGWKNIETDSIEENTLLYRIGRIIYIKTKLAALEEEKTKKELENTHF
jgi:hypothetical protein